MTLCSRPESPARGAPQPNGTRRSPGLEDRESAPIEMECTHPAGSCAVSRHRVVESVSPSGEADGGSSPPACEEHIPPAGRTVLASGARRGALRPSPARLVPGSAPNESLVRSREPLNPPTGDCVSTSSVVTCKACIGGYKPPKTLGRWSTRAWTRAFSNASA